MVQVFLSTILVLLIGSTIVIHQRYSTIHREIHVDIMDNMEYQYRSTTERNSSSKKKKKNASIPLSSYVWTQLFSNNTTSSTMTFQSDIDTIVQLSHCNLPTNIDTSLWWQNFTDWSEPILQQTFDNEHSKIQKLFLRRQEEELSLSSSSSQLRQQQQEQKQNIRKEFQMQLLEIYVTTYYTHYCDFSKYSFHTPSQHQDNDNENNIPLYDSFYNATQKLLDNEIRYDNHQSTINSSSFLINSASPHRHGYDHPSTYYIPYHNILNNSNNSIIIHKKNLVRIVFIIIAFQDFDHLQRLVQHLWMPQHLIVIHLEKHCLPPPSSSSQQQQQQQSSSHHDDQDNNNHNNNRMFVQSVYELASMYSNVLVLQFGTIIYETDSVSQINLEIMEWLLQVQDQHTTNPTVSTTSTTTSSSFSSSSFIHHNKPTTTTFLQLDYIATLGGAVFPLWSATELNQHLFQAKKQQQQQQGQQSPQVWMGELLHKGQHVHHHQPSSSSSSQAMLIWNRKRLYTTTTPTTTSTMYSSSFSTNKLELRLGNIFKYGNNNHHNNTVVPPPPVPLWLDHVMQYKSTSGNQAVYSIAVIRRLLHNVKVRQLFALAKYGCCCCIEERTWIAAMDLIGYLNTALHTYSMFQVWGGGPVSSSKEKRKQQHDDPNSVSGNNTKKKKKSGKNHPYEQCQGGMKNSILEINDDPTPCYRSEQAYHHHHHINNSTIDTKNDHPKNGSVVLSSSSSLLPKHRDKPSDREVFLSTEIRMNASGIWDSLVDAKSRGVLFARKFHSQNPRSMQLLQKIIDELHWHPPIL